MDDLNSKLAEAFVGDYETILRDKIEEKLNEASSDIFGDAGQDYLRGYINGLRMVLMLMEDTEVEQFGKNLD